MTLRDAHLDVVADDRQVIERMAVRTKKDEVLGLRVLALLKAVNTVLERRLPVSANLQTDRKWLARGGPRVGFVCRKIAKRVVAHVLDSPVLAGRGRRSLPLRSYRCALPSA